MKLSIIHMFLLVMLSILSHQNFSNANDTINTTQSIRGNETLVSGNFELGFFSPGNSNNRYVGIWYKNITPNTVVWVANREIPLKNSTSGIFKVIQPGFLVILNETNNIIWSSNNSRSAENPVAQLLNSGNLVLRDGDNVHPDNYLWQSFDYPTDTYLQGMEKNYLSSWKSDEDPAPGDFTLSLDHSGYLQVFIAENGVNLYRMGPWNGLAFSGTPNVRRDSSSTMGLYRNKEGDFYYREDSIDSSVISRFTLSPSGVGERWRWVHRTQGWVRFLNFPSDNCDRYSLCGAYGSCNIGNLPMCECLDKFVPKDPEGWMRADWSNGCVRRTPLNCTVGNGFLKYSDIKLPDARNSWYNESMTLKECKVKCLRNCSCMAYTNLNISNGGRGCLIWLGELVDIRDLSAGGQDVYIRMALSELDSNGTKKVKLILSLTIVGGILVILSLLLYIWNRTKNNTTGRNSGSHPETQNQDLELPMFDLSTISKATDSFSFRNKIGEGGYGPVYKGTLAEGQNIAVKRLSKDSNQGPDEFKNEVTCIAKLQHRNLVKLLGFCIQGEEKMLIYEYMPNKSLDLVLFDKTNRMYLDWTKRFHIINGIARGLMYLHQDSRLRIIHRDLKASNILLDNEMNPKISDFGLARRVKGNETEDKTTRVVGTYGYMSPEYATHGRFSVKSDVFSFGVLVLEIVTGKRNSSFSRGDRHLTLLGHAWTLYKEGRSIELIDTYLQDSACLDKVLRLIHVGLLCVQQSSDDRPTMTSVVSMLSNELVLPQANPPGFFAESHKFASEDNTRFQATTSTNELTITILKGR